jgi:putative ABC transport system permease protein
MESNDLQVSIAQIESKFTQLFPDSPFDYFFLDEHFDRQYRGEVLFGKVFTGIALMALFISCLGILGLSYQTIVQKTKEIGIRKVLGASLNELLLYLSKDYVKLVMIAYVMSIPIAYLVFRGWLNNFVARIDIGSWFFITPLLVLAIAIISVIAHQTLKVALKNPVDSLKHD